MSFLLGDLSYVAGGYSVTVPGTSTYLNDVWAMYPNLTWVQQQDGNATMWKPR